MFDVQKCILRVMKQEIFSSSESENKAARQIFAELKTKQKDVLEEVTAEIQYKFLKKMKAERADSIEVYKKANRLELLSKEQSEYLVITNMMSKLEQELPKMLSEEEIKKIISEEIEKVGKEKANMGIVMKAFKDIKNVDKSLVAKLVKEIL